MRMYCCQPTVTIVAKGVSVTKQVPTFYLDPKVQGIISVAHAEIIAEDICNPSKDPSVTVTANVTETDMYLPAFVVKGLGE